MGFFDLQSAHISFQACPRHESTLWCFVQRRHLNIEASAIRIHSMNLVSLLFQHVWAKLWERPGSLHTIVGLPVFLISGYQDFMVDCRRRVQVSRLNLPLWLKPFLQMLMCRVSCVLLLQSECKFHRCWSKRRPAVFSVPNLRGEGFSGERHLWQSAQMHTYDHQHDCGH